MFNKGLRFFSSLDLSLVTEFDFDKVCISSKKDQYKKFQPLKLKNKKIPVKALIAETYPFEMNIDTDVLLNSFPLSYF